MSSGEAEIETWAQPSPLEIAETERKKAFRKLPKELQQQIRAEDAKYRKETLLAKKEAKERVISEVKPTSADPFQDFTPVFPVSTGEIPVEPVHDTTAAVPISNPFNRAIYDCAVRYFPYFRDHCNLLLERGDTVAVREGGELRAFVHEEVGVHRVVMGVGFKGPMGSVREVRMFKVVL